MSDRVTRQQRSLIMKAVRTRDTGPEVVVRSLLHRMGYRFRLHARHLPGTPDIVLPKYKTVVFVHGCFWHAHGCPIGRAPKSRNEYWGPKLQANKERDKRNVRALRRDGWRVLTVWQCELRHQDVLSARLRKELGA